MAAPLDPDAQAAATRSVDAVIGCRDLVGAITGHVHDDDLLAWSLVCRATRGAQAAGGRALVTGNEACAGSVGRAAWARGLGAPIGRLQLAAASVGSVEALRWSVETAGCAIGSEHDGCELSERAAGSGSVDAVAWVRGMGCGWGVATCAEAALSGGLPVLRWLRSQDPPCPWNVWVCWAAAGGGHASLLQWVRSQDPPCPWDFWTLYAAQRGGHEELAAWLREAGCPAGAL